MVKGFVSPKKIVRSLAGRVSVLFLMMSCLSAVGVTAAPSADSGEVTADTLMTLREVSVTAIKRGTMAAADDAVTTIGSATVDRLGIVNLKQASEIAPNFYMPAYGSRMTSSVYVRGLGARIDQPVVGLNIDNIPIVNKDNFDFDLADIERIEILRGPQNILYGRNTMAGLINIYTISPLAYEGVRATVQYGSRNSYRASLGAYGRLAPNLGMALTGYATGTDGFFRNALNGSRVGRERQWSGRWKTVWRPTSKVIVENAATVSHALQNGYPYASAETGQVAYNDTCYYKRLTVTDGLTVKHSFRGVTFSSIISFQYINDDMTLDQDFLPVDYFTLRQKRHEWAVTADFVARGKAGAYNWLGGLFGFGRRTNMQAPVDFYDYGISQLIEKHRNELNPNYPVYWDDRHFLLGSEFATPSKGASVYHESEYSLGRWTATLGLRFDLEHVALSYRSHTNTSYTIYDLKGDEPAVYSHRNLDIDDRGRLSKTFRQLLPKLSVSYSLDGAGNIYGSVTKGYKAGGYNTQMFSDVLQQRLMSELGLTQRYDVDDIISYAPEQNYNYEAGAHLSFLGGDLKADVSLFWIECRNQQITLYPEGTVTGRIMANAGRSRSRGAELSLQGSLPGGFSLRGSYGFTDARFTSFSNGKSDFAGNRIPYAPANTFFASASYERGFRGALIDHLSLDLSVRGVGDIMWNEENTLRQPFYALLNASATVSRGNVSMELWANNITSTQYATFYFVSIGNAFLQKGNPFSCGVTLKWNLDL